MMSETGMELNSQWKPKQGEGYWYVSVPNSWDFESTKAIYKDQTTGEILKNNCFRTEAEAKKMANVIRKVWGYPPLA